MSPIAPCRLAIPALFFLTLTALPAAAAPQADVGVVAFAASGAVEARPAFLRGLALLHNFEYEYAAEAFREAQRVDPGFAMAYWGEAMTHTHPLWYQQDLVAAREALQRLAPTPDERLAKALTERERDYLRAVEVLYGEGGKEERDLRYAEAMAALHARWPDDVDAAAFHALAILGTSHGGRDPVLYMRSAALLEEVFPANPRHPGVLHYLIHSYDDPVHAPLGMRAARLYGEVAPEAGHALHMTSHIFVAMGMWNEVIDANRRAIAVVDRQRAARGRPQAHCGHYPLWLHYGYLQAGMRAEADAALAACRDSALDPEFVSGGPMDSREARLSSYAEMRAHQIAMAVAADGGGPRALPAGHDEVPLPEGGGAEGAHLLAVYGDLLAAAERGDRAAIAAAAGALRALRPTSHGEEPHDMPMPMMANHEARVAVMALQAEALELLAAGRRDEALRVLEEAKQAEEAMPFEFGPPIVPKPTAELLGDELLAAGRAQEAAAAYRASLRRAPGRVQSVRGLERARRAAAE
jgi:tetratricopeptide (TPR) repeat protein